MKAETTKPGLDAHRVWLMAKPVMKPMAATVFSLFMPVAIALFVGVLACAGATSNAPDYVVSLLLDSSTLFTIIAVAVMNIVDFIGSSTKSGSI